MEPLLFVLVCVALWIFIAPFIILGRLSDLSQRMESLEQLKTQIQKLTTPLSQEENSTHQEQLSTEAITPPLEKIEEIEEIEETVESVPLVSPPEEEPILEHVLLTVEPQEEPVEAIRPPIEERLPNPIETALKRLFTWLLSEGNIWVCVGVILFFVGFGLLFNYAIQMGWLNVEIRLAAAALTGIAMAAFGFHLREKRRNYGLILQGGGIGILYLVIMAASKFYGILPAAGAIVAMLILAGFTVLLALLQDHQPLAVFALLGGYIAPILVSTGSRNHVALFAIYSLLNIAILLITLKKNWSVLIRTGFVLTLAVAFAWGKHDWRLDLFASVEPFVLLFLATWTLISMLTARRFDEKNRTDLPLALSVPFVFFFLQTHVTKGYEMGMGLTGLGLGAWYFAFGLWGLRRQDLFFPTVSRLFVALCILFSNLVIPYAFDNSASSAVWAIEAAFLMFLAARKKSYGLLFFSLLLYGGSFYLYLPQLHLFDWSEHLKISPILLSGIVFAASFFAGSFAAARFKIDLDVASDDAGETFFRRFFKDGEWLGNRISWLFIILGSFWWWTLLYDQMTRLEIPGLSAFAFICATGYLGCFLALRFAWPAAYFLLLGPLGATLFIVGLYTLPYYTWYSNGGISVIIDASRFLWLNTLFYVIFVGGSLHLLRKKDPSPASKKILFVALFLGLQLSRYGMIDMATKLGLSGTWGWFASTLPLVGFLTSMQRTSFLKKQYVDYQFTALLSCGSVLFLSFITFFRTFLLPGGLLGPLFIPFLNPLELGQIVVLVSLVFWVRLLLQSEQIDGALKERLRTKTFYFSVFIILFSWLNQVAARGTWWYLLQDTGYPFDLWKILRTTHFQGVASIVWGLVGVVAIFYAKKCRNRNLWSLGAALLALDMVKLIFIDLNRAATLTRILAFLVLGGLFLLIGWVAPLPPKENCSSNHKTMTGEESND